MKNFQLQRDNHGNIQSIQTPLKEQALLNNPFLNKGNAFSEKEREVFQLKNLLPSTKENLEQQVEAAYQEFKQQPDTLSQYIY